MTIAFKLPISDRALLRAGTLGKIVPLSIRHAPSSSQVNHHRFKS
jgi:hypothetical protein